MRRVSIVKSIIGVLLCLISASASALLLGRAPMTEGGMDYQAYYDTGLGVTWIADLNLEFNQFGAESSVEYDVQSGAAWISELNTMAYLGVSTWRLPRIEPLNGTAYDFTPSTDGSTDYGSGISAPGTLYAGSTASELAYLYYNTLGNLPNAPLSNMGPFIDYPTGLALTGVPSREIEEFGSFYWVFDMGSGYQLDNASDGVALLALADGDVALIPIPPALWFFVSALVASVALRRISPSVSHIHIH